MFKLILTVCISVLILSCNNEPKESSLNSINNDTKKEKELLENLKKSDSNFENSKALIKFYSETNQLDKADNQRIILLQKDSLNYEVLQDLAMSFILKEDTANAIKYYEKLIKLNFPNRDIALQELAQIYAGKKDKKCLQIADGFIQMGNPFSKSIGNFLKGYFYSLQNDKKMAVNFLQNAIKDDPRNMNASQELGYIFYEQGEYLKSIEVLSKATTLNNGFCDGYFTMGKAFEKLGDTARAVNSFGFALQCNPNDEEAKEKLKSLGVK